MPYNTTTLPYDNLNKVIANSVTTPAGWVTAGAVQAIVTPPLLYKKAQLSRCGAGSAG